MLNISVLQRSSASTAAGSTVSCLSTWRTVTSRDKRSHCPNKRTVRRRHVTQRNLCGVFLTETASLISACRLLGATSLCCIRARQDARFNDRQRFESDVAVLWQESDARRIVRGKAIVTAFALRLLTQNRDVSRTMATRETRCQRQSNENGRGLPPAQPTG